MFATSLSISAWWKGTCTAEGPRRRWDGGEKEEQNERQQAMDIGPTDPKIEGPKMGVGPNELKGAGLRNKLRRRMLKDLLRLEAGARSVEAFGGSSRERDHRGTLSKAVKKG
eukprot:6194937-Pleurochrysis_carterae.AAC.2